MKINFYEKDFQLGLGFKKNGLRKLCIHRLPVSLVPQKINESSLDTELIYTFIE